MDTSVFIWALPLLTVLTIILRIVSVSMKKHLHSSKDIASDLQLTEPSCSSSSSSSPPTWDVFLSFYGKDTRRNFTSHLYSALDQAGILTFRDDPALEKGKEISSGLLDAIKHSKIFIVVVSENYARSSWCLDELVLILSCKRTEIHVVPVFYYVDPSDVRHQKGSFGKALDGHKKRYSVDIIEKWKSALSEIAALSGHHLRKEANENEAETIQEIVGNVATQASTSVLHLEKYLFGIDSAVEEIYQKLSMDSNDVRAIGICGMGGIGKTTIAKVFYNKHINKFDISCFSENVEQYSQGVSPLLSPLEQLLIDLLRKKNYKAVNVESKIRKLKQILHCKKALIILDDLDQSNYSELLSTSGNFFSVGSRIIITTRDANLLSKLKADIPEVDTYMVKPLGQIESLKLFSYHAFRKPVPPESFKVLSQSFVTHAGGLPLALKVLGSSLLGRTQESFWKDKLEKVRAIPENDIQKILQMSYDELDDETQKAIFLDIAFFFVGKDKDEAADVFKSCDLFPGVGIQNLVDRCLLTIDKYNRFEMHNLIQDMGRELGKTTRLFLRGNAWKDLQNPEGKNNVEGLILDLTTSADRQMSAVIFERMYNLRLLQIIDANDIAGSFENLLPKLRCIRWHYCPWTYLPSTFRPQNLISLDMPYSKFKRLWKRPTTIKQMNNLSCLYLGGCCNLKRLPDQLGDMKALKKIDVSYTAIEKLPDSITHLKELVELNLLWCRKLTKLPEQLGEMKGLKDLDAGCSAIKQLPDSITQMKGLVELSLGQCRKLRKLPEEIGNMEGLKHFNATGSAIEQLPDSFGSLVNLVGLYLSECKNLRNLPNSISKLKLLKQLHLNYCSNLEELPEHLGKMRSLEELYASETEIEQVPDSIGLLSSLRVLNFKYCKNLKFVPKSIWNLTSVEDLTLHSGETGNISLSDSVEDMKKLRELDLSCNVRLCLPMIQCFSSLERLTLTDEVQIPSSSTHCNVRCLPMIQCFSSLERLTLTDEGQILSSAKPFTLSKLLNLQHLTFDNCRSLGSSLPQLPLNLGQLNVINHNSLEQLPNLSSLRKLERLYIQGCINLQSISSLPSHLQSLEVEECTSLQDLPDLSMLKELKVLKFTQCYSLKSISLKPSSLQVGQPFNADLPNRKIAEWFNYKSSGHTVSFVIPPSFGSNFLGLALWVVYTCKAKQYWSYMIAVVTNETEGITEKYGIGLQTVVGEAESRVQCIAGEKLLMKSGDKIKVSIPSLLYSDYIFEVATGEEVKVKMCGVHLIQNRPST